MFGSYFGNVGSYSKLSPELNVLINTFEEMKKVSSLWLVLIYLNIQYQIECTQLSQFESIIMFNM